MMDISNGSNKTMLYFVSLSFTLFLLLLTSLVTLVGSCGYVPTGVYFLRNKLPKQTPNKQDCSCKVGAQFTNDTYEIWKWAV